MEIGEQRREPDETTADLPAPFRCRQAHPAQAHQPEHEEQRDEAAVKGDLDRRMRLRGQLDTNPHAGKKKAGDQHPEGLHSWATRKWKRRRILPQQLVHCGNNLDAGLHHPAVDVSDVLLWEHSHVPTWPSAGA